MNQKTKRIWPKSRSSRNSNNRSTPAGNENRVGSGLPGPVSRPLMSSIELLAHRQALRGDPGVVVKSPLGPHVFFAEDSLPVIAALLEGQEPAYVVRLLDVEAPRVDRLLGKLESVGFVEPSGYRFRIADDAKQPLSLPAVAVVVVLVALLGGYWPSTLGPVAASTRGRKLARNTDRKNQRLTSFRYRRGHGHFDTSARTRPPRTCSNLWRSGQIADRPNRCLDPSGEQRKWSLGP